MAQYSKTLDSYLPNNSTIHEVVMLSDSAGTLIGGNLIDNTNSTTTPLANTATWTGEWIDASSYDSIVVAVKTDQNGEFSVQFSPDGTNIDSSLKRYYRTNQIEAPHRFTITRRYVRITFTNTSTVDQTYLRLQTTLGSKTELNIPTDSNMAQDFDSISVRPTDFLVEAVLNRRQGYKTWNKWGYNTDVDSANEETIWQPGGRIQFLSTANTLNIVSSVGTDAVANTGANAVVVYGVDENFDELIEVVNLDGTNTVTTTGLFKGVNRMAIYLAGSDKQNNGTITATTSTGAIVQGTMPPGEGVTQQAIFFVPRGHQALVDEISFGVVKIAAQNLPVVTFKIWVHSEVSNAKYEVFRQIIDTGIENSISVNFHQPLLVGEKSLIETTLSTDINNTSVSARMSILVIRDVDE